MCPSHHLVLTVHRRCETASVQKRVERPLLSLALGVKVFDDAFDILRCHPEPARGPIIPLSPLWSQVDSMVVHHKIKPSIIGAYNRP